MTMKKEYPRYLILGALEHEQFITDSYYCGWVASPSIIQTVKQKICRHEFSLWCTNQGVPDVKPTQVRYCKKCGKEELRS